MKLHKTKLYLKDGSEWEGKNFGADKSVSGEVVFATGMAGLFYLGSALVLDAVFLVYAVAIWLAYTDSLAKRAFRFSIFYLAVLFAALMVDHYLPLLLPR